MSPNYRQLLSLVLGFNLTTILYHYGPTTNKDISSDQLIVHLELLFPHVKILRIIFSQVDFLIVSFLLKTTKRDLRSKTEVLNGLLPKLTMFITAPIIFLKYLALGITTNCICGIHCLALDGFNLNTGHKLSSKEKKLQPSRKSSLGLQGGKQEFYLCSTQPPQLLESYSSKSFVNLKEKCQKLKNR